MQESTTTISGLSVDHAPAVKLLSDNQAHRTGDLINQVGDEFQLTDA